MKNAFFCRAKTIPQIERHLKAANMNTDYHQQRLQYKSNRAHGLRVGHTEKIVPYITVVSGTGPI